MPAKHGRNDGEDAVAPRAVGGTACIGGIEQVDMALDRHGAARRTITMRGSRVDASRQDP
ncbi:MAG: hypothetical protein LBU45_01780 [Azoarcus sp.]|nr:hypothetical protein [Azoarcus sp.]